MTRWSQAEAIKMAQRLEVLAPLCGAHIALTGGCLYKEGTRKDLDIVVYRIRQAEAIDRDKFFHLLLALDIHKLQDTGFVVKALCGPMLIDFLFPESEGTYVPRAAAY